MAHRVFSAPFEQLKCLCNMYEGSREFGAAIPSVNAAIPLVNEVRHRSASDYRPWNWPFFSF
jgi:hypothetical protein